MQWHAGVHTLVQIRQTKTEPALTALKKNEPSLTALSTLAKVDQGRALFRGGIHPSLPESCPSLECPPTL